ncbi:MAG: HEAT repeat domain-containing protein [Alphaproteobacteria bacterium]
MNPGAKATSRRRSSRTGRSRLSAAFLLLSIASIAALASGCRKPVSPEKQLARDLASSDAATATAAVAKWHALGADTRVGVVRVLASETTKYPFGLADAPAALRRLLPEVVPVLVGLRSDPSMTSSADMGLQVLGPEAAAAAPALEAATRGDDPKLRARAAAALVSIVPARAAAVIAEHADGDPQVAIATGLQLRYVPQASLAVPGLAALLDSDRPRAREFAAGALAEVGPRGTQATVARLQALASSDPEPRVRRAAERALRAMPAGAPPKAG